MNINSLLDGLLNEQTVNELSQKTNAQPDQVQQAAQMVLPMLLQKLNANAATPEHASSLEQALDEHKDDDVSDVHHFVKNVNPNEGQKMLNHIFGNNKEQIGYQAAQKTGIDANSMMQLMAYLAPIVMGYLGNQKQKTENQSASHSGGIGDLLGQVTKEYMKSPKTDSSLLGSLSDLFDGDSANQKGSLGDLFSGLFK